jgi:hypothetical protein
MTKAPRKSRRKSKPQRESPRRSLENAMALSDKKKHQELAAEANRQQQKARGRKGKKGLVVYVDPPVTTAIRRLAAENGMTVQELCRYALNLLFMKHAVQTRA